MENDYKIKLEEEKKLLEEELSSLGKVDNRGDWEATPESEEIFQEVQDEADMAERSEDYTERSDKLNLLEKRLASIEKALNKIRSGNYGVCEICGDNIESDRLSVNPSAITCKKCMDTIS